MVALLQLRMTGETEIPTRGFCMRRAMGEKCRAWLRNSERPCIVEMLDMSTEMVEK